MSEYDHFLRKCKIYQNGPMSMSIMNRVKTCSISKSTLISDSKSQFFFIQPTLRSDITRACDAIISLPAPDDRSLFECLSNDNL